MRKIPSAWSASNVHRPYVANKTNSTVNTNCGSGIENIAERRKNWLKSIEQQE